MCEDIAKLLRDWPFDPEKNVRKILGDDGMPKLQVRLPLGVEQYELEGRPDGLRPEGGESYLDVFKEKLRVHVRDHGSDDGFKLSAEDCVQLRQESMLYYFRYLLCFQTGDFGRVQRDTERNMKVFRLVHEYAERAEDREAMEQYWPYIIRMHAMARALELAGKGQASEALQSVEDARKRIQDLSEVGNETFSLEKMRSLGVLEQMAGELREKAPPEEKAIVRDRLQKAIAEENYERAAQLRDLLRSMGG